MIRFTLKCENGHQFDSWFQSADAYEKLRSRGLTSCSICGNTKVEKALMAPRVSTREKSEQQLDVPDTPAPVQSMSLAEPSSPLEKAISKLRTEVEKNSDYVGSNFAKEARRMHEGDAPTRAIHGEARLDEARSLVEDGVPVMPLPFGPRDKAN